MVCGTQIRCTGSYIPGLIDITIGSRNAPDHIAPRLRLGLQMLALGSGFADDLPALPERPRVG